MISSSRHSSDGAVVGRRDASLSPKVKAALSVVLLVTFVIWVQVGSGFQVFRSEVYAEPGWDRFRSEYELNYFGEDGQFVRAVQNGYNLVFHTYKYASRFTRKVAGDRVNSCSGCHTVDDLAYGFVN